MAPFAQKEEITMAEETNDQKTKGSVAAKIRSYIDRGVEASRKGIKTAGSAISEFGDKSVLRIELTQLKSNLTKAYAELGEASYKQLTAKKTTTRSTKDDTVQPMVKKIDGLLKDIKKHDKAIKDIELAADTKKNQKKSKKSDKK